MIISYYGLACFKIQSGDTVLATDPFSKESGLTPPRFQADIVLSTDHAHPLHGNTTAFGGDPFVIQHPGEYETKGIMVEGTTVGHRTIFTVEWEGLRLCHLGALSEKNLPDSVRERIGTPDILFLPVGAGGALDANEAVEIINAIEPRIIIPMFYAVPGFKALPVKPLEPFLKEIGSSAKAEEKFTLKKKDVPQEEMQIVVLGPLASK